MYKSSQCVDTFPWCCIKLNKKGPIKSSPPYPLIPNVTFFLIQSPQGYWCHRFQLTYPCYVLFPGQGFIQYVIFLACKTAATGNKLTANKIHPVHRICVDCRGVPKRIKIRNNYTSCFVLTSLSFILFSCAAEHSFCGCVFFLIFILLCFFVCVQVISVVKHPWP